MGFGSCSRVWAAKSSPASSYESNESSLALSKALNTGLVSSGRTDSKLSVVSISWEGSSSASYLKRSSINIKLSCPLLFGMIQTSLRSWGGCLALLGRSGSTSSKAVSGFISVELVKSSNLSILEPTTLLKSIHKSGVGSLGILLSRIKATYISGGSSSSYTMSPTSILNTPYVGLSFLIRGLHILSGTAGGDRSVGILLGRVSLDCLTHDLIYRAEGIECGPSGVICGCLMAKLN